MKMELNLNERFTLVGLLPPKEDMLFFRLVHRARKALLPNEAEVEKYKIENKATPDGKFQTVWEYPKDKTGKAIDEYCEIELMQWVFTKLSEKLKELHTKKEIGSVVLYVLHKRFVEGKTTKEAMDDLENEPLPEEKAEVKADDPAKKKGDEINDP